MTFGELLVPLLPVGQIAREDLNNLQKNLSAMGVECTVGRSVPAPETDFNPRRKQYLGNAFLALAQRAAPTITDPRGKVLAVTAADLYADDLNFILGMAGSRGRTAVISLCWLGLGADRQARRLRILKEAVHEIGHSLGLGHCPDPKCVMHFSNALADTDSGRVETQA